MKSKITKEQARKDVSDAIKANSRPSDKIGFHGKFPMDGNGETAETAVFKLNRHEGRDIMRALQQSAEEIRRLRKEISRLADKERMFERMMSLFEARPYADDRNAMASEDVAYKCDHLAMKFAEER